jgi:hypothetical protein
MFSLSKCYFLRFRRTTKKGRKFAKIRPNKIKWVSSTSHFSDFMRLRGCGRIPGISLGPRSLHLSFWDDFCEVERSCSVKLIGHLRIKGRRRCTSPRDRFSATICRRSSAFHRRLVSATTSKPFMAMSRHRTGIDLADASILTRTYLQPRCIIPNKAVKTGRLRSGHRHAAPREPAENAAKSLPSGPCSEETVHSSAHPLSEALNQTGN